MGKLKAIIVEYTFMTRIVIDEDKENLEEVIRLSAPQIQEKLNNNEWAENLGEWYDDEEMLYGGPFSGKDNPPHFVEFSPQRKELRKLWNELKGVDWEKFLYDAEQYNNAYKDCYPDQGDAPIGLIVKQITQ